MKKYLLVIIIIFFIFGINVKAYTKDDIINLGKSVNYCSVQTETTASEILNSYSKIIKERNISEDDLNIIYNNLSKAINILKNNNVCNTEQLKKLNKNIKDNLISLYDQTNKIIVNSPLISNSDDNQSNTADINITYDTSTKSIQIYDGNALADVITVKKELNDVGLNINLKIIISMFIILFIISLFKILIFKKDIISLSILYLSIFCLPNLFIYKNQISILLDMLPKNSFNLDSKDILVIDKEIISYPSYGKDYGYIYINNTKDKLYYGDTLSVLAKGIGTSSSMGMPGENQSVILSGHNTGLFNKLDNLKINDEVTLETLYGLFTYKIINSKIVNKDDINSLNNDYDLIMYTCYPNNNLYGNKRLVVYANLINSDWLGES